MTRNSTKTKVAILGSGNIGTDLMIKIARLSDDLQMAVLAGIDPSSPGLAKARALGIATTDNGIEGLTDMQVFEDVDIVFDATSAGAHARHHAVVTSRGKRLIDLTPAALGPYTVPVVNMDAHLDQPNINMVTCGGQATIPIVAAISGVVPVHYGEIIASIASRSAGPGTRANIDEFTETTARGLEIVGGAKKGKAIIILNPGEPPLIMRDTIYCLSDDADPQVIRRAVDEMVARVQAYVPGYRLKQEVQFERFGDNNRVHIPGFGDFTGLRTSVFIEVEGAGHFLPPYAGNLDIMTSAALATAERLAISLRQGGKRDGR